MIVPPPCAILPRTSAHASSLGAGRGAARAAFAYAALLLGGVAASAACTVPRIYLVPGGITPVSVTTDRNAPCRVTFGRYGSRIRRFTVVSRPRFGIVGKAAQTATTLDTADMPQADYIGPDAFEADLDYTSPTGMAHTTRLSFRVDVR